jgi:hypothetical protein
VTHDDDDDAERGAPHAFALRLLTETGARAVAAVSVDESSDGASVVVDARLPELELDRVTVRLARHLEGAAIALRNQVERRRAARGAN